MQKFKGHILILLSAVMFGSYGIWSKLLGTNFGIFFQGWTRSLIVLIILLPIAYFTNNFKKIRRSDVKWLSIPVIFGVLTQAPLYYAFNHADIGVASVIFFAVFLLTSYTIGWLFLKEKITLVKIISFCVALMGLFLSFGFSLKQFSIAALLAAALNGIASGGEVSTTKKSSDRYSSLQITILIWLGILITHIPLSFIFHEPQIPLTLNREWFSMLAYAISGILGFWLVVEGFKYVDASIGGLIGLLEIVFSIAFGIFFFHEHLTTPLVIGTILILIAASLPSLYDRATKD